MTTGFFLGSIKDLTLADAVATQVDGEVPALKTNVLEVSDRILDNCVDIGNSVLKVASSTAPAYQQLVSGLVVIGQKYKIENLYGTKQISLFGSVSGACNISLYYSGDNLGAGTFKTSLGDINFTTSGTFSRDWTTSAPYIAISFDSGVTADIWVSLL